MDIEISRDICNLIPEEVRQVIILQINSERLSEAACL